MSKQGPSLAERILNRLFKKREIVNCDRDVYLHRWYVFRSKPVSLFIHKFVRSDEDRALHCHPWDFLVIPIWRGYIEHNRQWDDGEGTRHGPPIPYEGRTRVLPILGTRFRRAEYRHRVELLPVPSKITPEEFERLGNEWLGCEYTINASYRIGETQAATKRILEIEKAIREAPYEYSEDDKIKRKELPSWSLFFHFTKRRDWGFWLPEGFKQWAAFWQEKCE